MRHYTRAEWIAEQNQVLETVIKEQWVRSKKIQIVRASDVAQETIDAVVDGVETAIAEIGVQHQVQKSHKDYGLTRLVGKGFKSAKPLRTREMTAYFRPHKTGFRLSNGWTYRGPHSGSTLVVVTKSRGIKRHIPGRGPSKGLANVRQGMVYLPIPSEREGNTDYTKALTVHEMGHILGLQIDHHDVLEHPINIDGSVAIEGKPQQEPYIVEGDPDTQCAMRNDIPFKAKYTFDEKYCPRFLETARVKWRNVEMITGVRYLQR